MVCPNCGSANEDGVHYCLLCGAELSQSNAGIRGFCNSPQNSFESDSANPNRELFYHASSNPSHVSSGGNSGGRPPHELGIKRMRRNKTHIQKPIFLALAVVVFALIGIGFAVIVFGFGNQVVLRDNVIIYDTKNPSFNLLDYDNHKLKVSELGPIKNDSVLVFPVTEKTPNGLLAKVKEINKAESSYDVVTEQAALTDAIETCDVSSEIAFLPGGESQQIESTDEAAFGFTKAEAADSKDFKAFSFDNGTVKDEASLSPVISLKMDAGKVDMKLGIKIREETELSLQQEQELAEAQDELFQFSKPVTVMIGPLPLVLSNTLEITMPVHAVSTAPLMEKTSTNKIYGFQYSSDKGIQPLESGESSSEGPKFSNPAGRITTTLSFGPQLHYACMLYGVGGPNLSAALENKLDANLTVCTDSEEVPDPIVIPGTDVKAWGSINGSVNISLSGKFTSEITGASIFDYGSNKLEAELFNPKDAATLWSVTREVAGPELYSNLTNNNTSQAVTGVLRIMTRAEANERYGTQKVYGTGMPIKDGSDLANAKVVLLELDKEATLSSCGTSSLLNPMLPDPSRSTLGRGSLILLGADSGEGFEIDFSSQGMSDIASKLSPYNGREVTVVFQSIPSSRGAYELVRTSRASDNHISLLGTFFYTQHFKVVG